MNPFLANQFGIQFIPGVGHVELKNPSAGLGHLGDDASVMMISGLGAADAPLEPASKQIAQTTGGGLLIKKWWEMVPWWVWVLVAVGALSAGAYLFRNLKKVA